MQYAVMIVLLVLVVALFVVSYVRRKRYNSELSLMRDELKIGDKVMTDTGMVGEVADMFVEEEYKYVVLKSGRGERTGYFTVHANAIYYVFGKEEKEKKPNMANVKKEKDGGSAKESETAKPSETPKNEEEKKPEAEPSKKSKSKK